MKGLEIQINDETKFVVNQGEKFQISKQKIDEAVVSILTNEDGTITLTLEGITGHIAAYVRFEKVKHKITFVIDGEGYAETSDAIENGYSIWDYKNGWLYSHGSKVVCNIGATITGDKASYYYISSIKVNDEDITVNALNDEPQKIELEITSDITIHAVIKKGNEFFRNVYDPEKGYGIKYVGHWSERTISIPLTVNEREYYYSDYLLKTGKITKEQYDAGLLYSENVIKERGTVD